MNTITSIAKLLLVGVGGLAFAAALAQQPMPDRIANAKPGEVRVLVSGALSAALESVRAQAQAAVGKPLVIEYGPSRSLQAQIEAGAPFELALLTREVREDMISKGRVVAEPGVELAKVVLAVGQRGPAPPQNVSTPAALKATLLGAKAIRYFEIGASVPSIEKVFKGLDVGNLLQDRIILLGGGRRPQDPVLGAGEYELIFNLASEVIPANSGWTFLGEVPVEFQIPVVIVAGIGATGDPEPARALIEFLQGPAIEPALKTLGMTR